MNLPLQKFDKTTPVKKHINNRKTFKPYFKNGVFIRPIPLPLISKLQCQILSFQQ